MNFLRTAFAVVLIVLSFAALVPPAQAYVSVKGYYKSNGTYVQPHVRSNPNGLKYDNYSWTPSQGLYNDTYGTRGSEWDTPTYVTDPDYYEGKALYESGSYSSGSSYSSGTYSSYPNTSTSVAPKKEEKTLSRAVKSWVEANPGKDCLTTMSLVAADRIECQNYRQKKELYSWKVVEPYSSYPSCGGTTYYADACSYTADFVCVDGKASCAAKQAQSVVQAASGNLSSGITQDQANAIISLLISFGAEQPVIESVRKSLFK